MRDLEPADRRVADGVPVDGPRRASIDRDAKRAAGHREALDRHLSAEHLNGGTPRVRRIDRRPALTIEREAQHFGLDQQVLATCSLHQDDVTRLHTT